jgi:hypothetical protein
MSTTNYASLKNRRTVITLALVLGVLAVIYGFLYWSSNCPCDRTPGGYLWGEQSQEVITDWSFVNDVSLCQLQASVFFIPYSINMNCSSLEKELFIGCMDCEGKRWGAAVAEQGVARFRVNGIVYPVAVRRLLEPAEMDHAWLSSSIKAERPIETPRPPDSIWWSFQLTASL